MTASSWPVGTDSTHAGTLCHTSVCPCTAMPFERAKSTTASACDQA